jgi:ABC-type multidrug transport system ATPase subunit
VNLVITQLSKTYPNGVHALRGVSLAIRPGMFGLLGPNGAGKSTLMRILATLQEADSGEARLGPIDVLRDKESLRRTLGYLPQEFGVYPKSTAEEMLDHFALLKGITSKSERRDTVAALLRQTNLWDARRRRLDGFSGGMRQRFGIAVALIGDPRLIIVDEPTAGLDPAERARFLNLLSELGERAVVILSTHIVEDVSELCTRMAIIERGSIRLEAEPMRAVEALRGRVWRRGVDRALLPKVEEALPVISTTLVGGRTLVHVYGDAPPDSTWEPVEPDLKDVYFTVMKGIEVAPDVAAAIEPEPLPPLVLPPPPPKPAVPVDADAIGPTDWFNPLSPPPLPRAADEVPPPLPSTPDAFSERTDVPPPLPPSAEPTPFAERADVPPPLPSSAEPPPFADRADVPPPLPGAEVPPPFSAPRPPEVPPPFAERRADAPREDG